MKPTYSICITHRNNRRTLPSSLLSILGQVDDRYEVVVVDGESTDGSHGILRSFAESGKIKLVSVKCTRGEGRQIAFENSEGDYIIANLDMDEVYRPRLDEVLRIFHANAEDKLLLVAASDSKNEVDLQNITIASRALIREIGGWRNLNYGEDWDLWQRASKIGRFEWTVFPLIINQNLHPERRNLIPLLKWRYTIYKESVRLGRAVFSNEERVTIAQRGAYVLAKVGALFEEHYPGEKGLSFNPHDARYRL